MPKKLLDKKTPEEKVPRSKPKSYRLPGQGGLTLLPSVEVKQAEEKLKELKTPKQIIAALYAHQIKPEWVSPRARQGCIVEMMHQGMRGIDIAEIFHVSPSQITLDKHQIMKRFALISRDFNADGFIGWLMAESEYLMSKAKQTEDYALAANIMFKLTDTLQGFGIMKVFAQRMAAQIAASPESAQEVLDAAFDKLSDAEFDQVKTVIGQVLERATNAPATQPENGDKK